MFAIHADWTGGIEYAPETERKSDPYFTLVVVAADPISLVLIHIMLNAGSGGVPKYVAKPARATSELIIVTAARALSLSEM